MLLSNYFKLKTQAYLTTIAGSYVITDLGYQIKRSDGTSVTIVTNGVNGCDRLVRCVSLGYISTSIPPISTTSVYYKYIVFGDGDTPVSIDDYSISGNIIPNISIVATTAYLNDNIINQVYTFRNGNNYDITIREVCIFDDFADQANVNSYKVALYREVFDEPITIPANSSFDYTLSITE